MGARRRHLRQRHPLDRDDVGRKGVRDEALMEASLFRCRLLIDFLCGDTDGGRLRKDMHPSDFLGYDWRPRTDMKTRLRALLSKIDRELAHLSWQRLARIITVVRSGSLAADIHRGLSLFVEAAQEAGCPGLASLEGPRKAAQVLAAAHDDV